MHFSEILMSANKIAIFRIKHSKRIENYTTFYMLRNNAGKHLKTFALLLWDGNIWTYNKNSEIITCNTFKWEPWCFQRYSLVPCWYENIHRTWECYVLKIKTVAKWHDAIHVAADSNTLDSMHTWFLVMF